ncbi:MAG: malate synthase G [Pseudoprimorskyibacter sp.]|nr:malate synthase G [Pseudoprimorskyibacter sp.]
MTTRIERNGLKVSKVLGDFIEQEALPGTGVEVATFWTGFAELIHEMGPQNVAFLEKRADIQAQIDAWHVARKGQVHDHKAYTTFLRDIGYLVPEGTDFVIETQKTDPEIAKVPGPQLVVPITNARFAINAANARWGSLYDAFYGTDALGDLPSGRGYDPARGARVVARAKVFLDEAVPLDGASWSDVTGFSGFDTELQIKAPSGASLRDPAQYMGYRNDGAELVFVNNGLHIRVMINAKHAVGATDPANIADVVLESALSTIMDCEDSVAAVDGADKTLAYANWLGLMQGTLTETVTKNGRSFERVMAQDIDVTCPDGTIRTLKGRSLMLVRNVGHLMTNPAILDRDGNEAHEGLMDAMMTTLIAMHDLARDGGNSVTGSVYVVKPKMHGPEEVAFADQIFSFVENVLGLPQYTVKLGIMDEERRTSANLRECIRAAKNRVAFINTGFLDRTGDEMHTSMEAGPMLPKGEIKSTPWIAAYEDRNVDIGLACGLQGRAQIGKGMWAMPDLMADMIETKVGHPLAGANCAWVPSPTAATLHAMHYHSVDVLARQRQILADGPRGTLNDLLTFPVMDGRNLSNEEIQREIDNNAQGILGYVVRWVDQGIGCSKVLDIHDVGLMEDRATCRISAQHIANWLHHGVVTRDDVMATLKRMAAVVDGQNAGDQVYNPMAPAFDGIAFHAACDLVFEGRVQPSGYTEPVLHRRRLELKAR